MDHFIADDGEPIHFRASGDGPPLVLLHGWTSSHRDWNPFVEPFATAHAVYRWDARAHGGHPLQTRTVPTVERMARDLHNLLCRFDLNEVTLVGHSMGALTTWQYLRDFGSERLARAVLIDQSPKLVTDDGWDKGIYGHFDWQRNVVFMRELERDFAEAVLRLAADGLNEAARRRYLARDDGLDLFRQRMRKLVPKPLIDCWASLTAADYREVLPRMDVPTLLVYGELSNFYTAETARYVRDAIPQARLVSYEGVDHSPHLWQRERFIRDVLSFAGEIVRESCVADG